MNETPALILGCTSDIGRVIARMLAQRGHPLHLAARDAGQLRTEAEDIRIRTGVPTTTHRFDVLADDPAFIGKLSPPPGIVVCVIGFLGDQEQSIRDPMAAELVMRSNYLGPARTLEAAARALQKQGAGTIVGVSSVAGERGRGSNYVYGSAKAGLTAYLSGLRARLQGTKIRVVTILPGFVDTRMTAGMDLPGILTAQPHEVARAVLAAIDGRGRDVVYVRAVWRLIMAVIRALPEPVFKRLRF